MDFRGIRVFFRQIMSTAQLNSAMCATDKVKGHMEIKIQKYTARSDSTPSPFIVSLVQANFQGKEERHGRWKERREGSLMEIKERRKDRGKAKKG